MENPGNLWIHGNHVVALDCDPLVTAVDLCVHPGLEILTHNCVDDVGQIGPAKLLDFFAWRQGALDVPVILCKVEDVLDG